MVKLIVVCAVIATGCSNSTFTTGEWDTDNQSKEPYIFRVPDDAKTKVKSVLYQNAWAVETDDGEWLITKERELAKDEDVNTNLVASMFNADKSEFSKGVLQFQFTDTLVAMRAKNWKGKYGEVAITQGHPFMMKYRRALEKSGFVLVK